MLADTPGAVQGHAPARVIEGGDLAAQPFIVMACFLAGQDTRDHRPDNLVQRTAHGVREGGADGGGELRQPLGGLGGVQRARYTGGPRQSGKTRQGGGNVDLGGDGVLGVLDSSSSLK